MVSSATPAVVSSMRSSSSSSFKAPAASSVAGVASMVCYLIAFYQMCNAVNFFVDLRDREATHGVMG